MSLDQDSFLGRHVPIIGRNHGDGNRDRASRDRCHQDTEPNDSPEVWGGSILEQETDENGLFTRLSRRRVAFRPLHFIAA